MIEKGLLIAELNQDDKRVQKLILTQNQYYLGKKIMPTMEERQKKLVEDISPKNRALLQHD